MRVLVGHTNKITQLLENRPLPGREGRGDEYLSFGFSNPNIPYHKGMTWQEIRSLCPAGWQPDLYIHWSPEYNPVPLGIENADCLTVGVFGDWNLGGQAIHAVGSLFDLLIADTPGAEHLRHAGFPQVLSGLLWAYQPELHRPLPNIERDIDILMIGNFNHAVQQERSLWLARVARLAQKHRVVLTSGVYGEEYVKMMNRAKIVFNRSIRGEMNMRAYEAPACGAMLFYERENREIAQVFQEGVECVLYDENDLESLFEHYLAPENAPERERITQAGMATVQRHTYAHHFTDLLNQIEPFLSRPHFRTPNPQGVAQQWLTCFEPSLFAGWEQIQQEMEGEANSPEEQAQVLGLQATRYAQEAWLLPACPQKEMLLRAAMQTYRQALEHNPDHAILWSNLGLVALFLNEKETGVTKIERAISQLETGNLSSSLWDTVLYPRQYDYYLVQMERVRLQSPEQTSLLQELLASRLYLVLSEVLFQETDFSYSLHFAQKATALTPQNPVCHYRVARAARALGDFEMALAHFEQNRTLAPFDMQAWEESVQLLLDLGRGAEAQALLENLLELLYGAPFYTPQRLQFERFLSQAKQIQQQENPLKNLTCVLAFPDWEREEDWQALVRTFAQNYRATDPVLLMLRADPRLQPNASALLQQTHRYLTQNLTLPANTLPRITLLNSALNSDDLWKLFQIADSCLITEALPPSLSRLAGTLAVPILTLSEFGGQNGS
jgi:tetratricopeptide (TPR) repeat protein